MGREVGKKKAPWVRGGGLVGDTPEFLLVGVAAFTLVHCDGVLGASGVPFLGVDEAGSRVEGAANVGHGLVSFAVYVSTITHTFCNCQELWGN